LRTKLGTDSRVRILHQDAAAMSLPEASYDQAVLFFLLHEQPEHVRRRTLAEAWRVVKPGGKIVIVDYCAPRRWHPLRVPMSALLRRLEPYALDLWRQRVHAFLPDTAAQAEIARETFFGGLYQKLVVRR
jgi:ubiquinone/menaquinone biosynthesis C-methylase UbiE